MTVRPALLVGGLLAGGLLLGVVSGTAAVVLHQSWSWLLLALVAAAATATWLSPGAARVGFATGWAIVVVRGTVLTSEGDYLVPGNAAGWTLQVGTYVLVLAAVVTLRPRRGAVGDHEDRPAPT